MKDNRLGGVALVAGAIAGMITMSLHPTGHHGIMSRHEMEVLALLTKAVHALAITSLPFSFLGCMVLTRRLASPSRIALAALVVYGFAAVAVMIAASMSGFLAPGIISKLVAGDPLTDTRRLFLEYNFQVNQAFASVYVVGSCMAIVLWSTAILKTRQLAAGLGIYGIVLGLAIVAALFSGKLALDVHGMGLVTFTQSIWLIIAGILLWRIREEPISPASVASDQTDRG
jgi:hypothetical protein